MATLPQQRRLASTVPCAVVRVCGAGVERRLAQCLELPGLVVTRADGSTPLLRGQPVPLGGPVAVSASATCIGLTPRGQRVYVAPASLMHALGATPPERGSVAFEVLSALGATPSCWTPAEWRCTLEFGEAAGLLSPLWALGRRTPAGFGAQQWCALSVFVELLGPAPALSAPAPPSGTGSDGKWVRAGQGRPGQAVLVVGTPHAALSPRVFLGSASSGIVSSSLLAGDNHLAALLTDAPCGQGMAGSAVMARSGSEQDGRIEQAEWLGVLLPAIVRPDGHFIQLRAALPSESVLSSVMGRLALRRPTSAPATAEESRATPAAQIAGVGVGGALLCVRCRGSWGTGFIISRKHRLALTCGHVVADVPIPSAGLEVRVQLAGLDGGSGEWLRATVLCCTEVPDIAVLRLEEPPQGTPLHLPSELCIRPEPLPHRGSAVFALGFPLLGPDGEAGRAAIATAGVATAVRHRGADAMLRMSATVYPGSSGGPVVTPAGQLVGLVTSHSQVKTERDPDQVRCSFAVPAALLAPVAAAVRALDAGEEGAAALAALEHRLSRSTDPALVALWQLRDTAEPGNLLVSKL